MAARGWSDWAVLLHTILGTALTAAGASVMNQYVERDLDAKMPRTANRPLPAGRVSPVEALAMGVALSAAGVLYLASLVTPGAWALFSILFFWQLPHFLAIAILYRDDYAAGGMKMLPVLDPGGAFTGRQIVLWS